MASRIVGRTHPRAHTPSRRRLVPLFFFFSTTLCDWIVSVLNRLHPKCLFCRRLWPLPWIVQVPPAPCLLASVYPAPSYLRGVSVCVHLPVSNPGIRAALVVFERAATRPSLLYSLHNFSPSARATGVRAFGLVRLSACFSLLFLGARSRPPFRQSPDEERICEWVGLRLLPPGGRSVIPRLTRD